MISPVSFTGTYKVDSRNFDSFNSFQKYAHNKEFKTGVSVTYKSKKAEDHESFKSRSINEIILTVPDEMDKDVERYCKRYGINFIKNNSQALASAEQIVSRIADAPKGYKKVDVDVEKLENIAKRQVSNLSGIEYDYNNYYPDSLDDKINGQDEIKATTLFIEPSFMHLNNDEKGINHLRKYVEVFGINGLNDKQIGMSFGRTDDYAQYTYFVLRNMGMKKIPVYVDDKTYKSGKILKLF